MMGAAKLSINRQSTLTIYTPLTRNLLCSSEASDCRPRASAHYRSADPRTLSTLSETVFVSCITCSLSVLYSATSR
jgi:hypothetical protein